VDLIVQRAAGNAFFLEELIRAASEGRTEMPETIVAMIDSRLGALEDASRRILRAASVFGETFWKGSVRVLVGDDAEDLGPKLDDLARREFLTRREGSRVAGEVEYTFRHALVRDGAYAMLTKADRVLGHRLAAEWLEKVGEGAAHVIAEHFAKSGDGRAVGAYLRAAEQAFESNDLATAIDCAERGIDLGAVGETRGALHAVRASALLWRGDLAEFERATAALVSEGTDVWWNAVERLVNAAGKLTDVDVVLATVERIDQAASAQTVSRHVALAIAAAVTTLVHLGRYDSAKRLLRFAEGDAVAREGIPAAAFAQARARLDLALGDIGAFRTQMAFARQVYENAGEMKQSCQCTLSSGYGALLIGQYAEAERELKRALELASQLDVPRVVLSAKHNLGLVFLRLGRIEESVAIESEALHLAREQKNLRMEGACLYYLSLVLHALGDFDAAEARALESVQACEHIPPSRGEALAALARARIAKGNVSQATADAKEALDIAEAVGGIDEGEPFIRLVYAEALHASGALSEAREAISEARTHLEARAQKITDPGARATFLSVPENARTLELAQRW
jgi:tetratricopeptide (TPR) repeat protein